MTKSNTWHFYVVLDEVNHHMGRSWVFITKTLLRWNPNQELSRKQTLNSRMTQRCLLLSPQDLQKQQQTTEPWTSVWCQLNLQRRLVEHGMGHLAIMCLKFCLRNCELKTLCLLKTVNFWQLGIQQVINNA